MARHDRGYTGSLSVGQRPIRVAIADDYADFRENVAKLISSEPDMSLAGSASNGGEAVTLAQQVTPDVILMDVNMPEMDGFTATEIIKGTVPSCSIIVLLYDQPPDYERRAFEAGATACLRLAPPRGWEDIADLIRTSCQAERQLVSTNPLQPNRYCAVCGAGPGSGPYCGTCGADLTRSTLPNASPPASTSASFESASKGVRPLPLRWLGNLLLGAGVLVILASQLYLLILTFAVLSKAWGILGILLLVFFPPSWALTPILMWLASGTFPLTYFIVWLGGWIGGGILFSIGSALRGA